VCSDWGFRAPALCRQPTSTYCPALLRSDPCLPLLPFLPSPPYAVPRAAHATGTGLLSAGCGAGPRSCGTRVCWPRGRSCSRSSPVRCRGAARLAERVVSAGWGSCGVRARGPALLQADSVVPSRQCSASCLAVGMWGAAVSFPRLACHQTACLPLPPPLSHALLSSPLQSLAAATRALACTRLE